MTCLKQEFSLRERVYIYNTYMKSRKSCSETRRKFRIKFPGRPVPNPSTIRRQAKRFKDTGSVKNINVNRWRHVLKGETLDDIGERLAHTPQKSLKSLSQETGVLYLCRLYKEQENYWWNWSHIKFQLCTRYISQIQISELRFCIWVLKKVNSGELDTKEFFNDEAWFYLHGQVC